MLGLGQAALRFWVRAIIEPGAVVVTSQRAFTSPTVLPPSTSTEPATRKSRSPLSVGTSAEIVVRVRPKVPPLPLRWDVDDLGRGPADRIGPAAAPQVDGKDAKGRNEADDHGDDRALRHAVLA
jgi:hypothetical protein